MMAKGAALHVSVALLFVLREVAAQDRWVLSGVTGVGNAAGSCTSVCTQQGLECTAASVTMHKSITTEAGALTAFAPLGILSFGRHWGCSNEKSGEPMVSGCTGTNCATCHTCPNADSTCGATIKYGNVNKRVCWCIDVAAAAAAAAAIHYQALAGFGGDPVTHYGGIERKFQMPNGQLTTLLQAENFAVRASAFPGEAPDEQWIDRVIVESRDGEQVVDVKIRGDIASFDRGKLMEGSFETIEVMAPWFNAKQLTFPSTAEHLYHWGQFELSLEQLKHPKDITVDIFRALNPKGIDEVAPVREGVLITSGLTKFAIVSASALEYYWDDVSDFRALKYSHLDLDFLAMPNVSSFSGLLPEVWGLIPATNQSQPTSNLTQVTATERQEVRGENGDSRKKTGDVEHCSSERSLSSRELRKHILMNLLEPDAAEAMWDSKKSWKADVASSAGVKGTCGHADVLHPGAPVEGATATLDSNAGKYGEASAARIHGEASTLETISV